MIFVLGAKGFIGSAFCEVCREYDIPCQGIDLDNYERFKGSRCDVLINANGSSKKYLAENNPQLDFDLSVSSVIHSFFDFRSDKYVYLSSVAVYNDHANLENNHELSAIDTLSQSNYGFHKYLAEQLVIRYCRNWLILRLGGVVGPHMTKGPIFDIINKIPLRLSKMSRFQFISTIEVARLAFRMLKEGCDREIFNICARGTMTLGVIQEMVGHAEENDLPLEIWNVNTDKTHKRFGLSTTEETIREFMSSNNNSQGR